jgi:hypothetical protein
MLGREKKPGKNSSDSSATPVQTGLFRSRPFTDPTVSDEVSPHKQELPDLQTQLERGARFSQSLSRMKVHPNKPVIQPKITVGAPGDKYEQEADQMAAQVMSMAAPVHSSPVQRQAAPEEEEVQTKPLAGFTIQRDKEKVSSSGESTGGQSLTEKYNSAVEKARKGKDNDWFEAAVLLNGFSTSDIFDKLYALIPDEREKMAKNAGWVTRVSEPIKSLKEGLAEGKNPEEIKRAVLQLEDTRVKKLKADYDKAVKDENWSNVALLLNAFSDADIATMLKKLTSSQRVAMYYTAPLGMTRVKEPIAKLDKIEGAADVGYPELEQIKKLYSEGITVAIYVNYKPDVRGASEFKRAGEEFAKRQNAVALSGGKVVIGSAIAIKELSEVTIAVQRIHLGLIEKYKQSQTLADKTSQLPKFTKIKNLALFAHGEPYGVGLEQSNKFELKQDNVKTFVSGLKDALVEDVQVQLFACSTGADRKRIESKVKEKGDKKGKEEASYLEWTGHEQYERSGADSFAASLAKGLGSESTVYGHTTVGHTTENFAARVFGKGAGGGEGGLHLFDLMYPKEFIKAELERLFPDTKNTESERKNLHYSMREQMWSHYKASIQTGKYRDHYKTSPIGQEMLINPDNARKLLHKDWTENWIPNNLKAVKPKSDPKPAK